MSLYTTPFRLKLHSILLLLPTPTSHPACFAIFSILLQLVNMHIRTSLSRSDHFSMENTWSPWQPSLNHQLNIKIMWEGSLLMVGRSEKLGILQDITTTQPRFPLMAKSHTPARALSTTSHTPANCLGILPLQLSQGVVRVWLNEGKGVECVKNIITFTVLGWV